METFKSICKFKGLDSLIGTGSVDAEGNKSIVLLNGMIVPSNLIMYQGREVKKDILYKLSAATCGHDKECRIGVPKQACIDKGVYSLNKCAVYYISVVDPTDYTFELTYSEIEALIKQLLV